MRAVMPFDTAENSGYTPALFLFGGLPFMPTYEYECDKCGHAFERFQSMTEAPVKRCPLCRCKVRRLVGTGAGIIFKGSGFYETDYRSSTYKEEAKKAEGADSPKKKEKKDSEPAKAGKGKSKKALQTAD